MDWSIQDIARIAGTTSRTLRHYDDIGLLKPSRTGHNGYRYYNQAALVQLQRILLLRGLGLGLPVISQVLDDQADAATALAGHLEWLKQEQDRLARQIASVRQTIEAVKGGGEIMAEDMFNGFDHTQYKDEVEERWGKDAYARGDAWWRGMGAQEKAEWKQRSQQLGADWIAAATSGIAPDSPEAQDIARRHVQWLTNIPGTPAAHDAGAAGGQGTVKAYVTGLGEMYVADHRFGANYGGPDGAAFVRDALAVYAERNL
ncbi:MerR family transcriptional regulator [Arthrobacter sp. CDRTa11]|uniref:MerR family transcriptional regulator n=1 Tax=Arthrobacter sp. CDRTa11 TaxID=2651199 RepID=UPI002265964E|nr:MerR family transcriptional regulator [Arthrobacter sp. CDRTa11]UZX04482.1 MerR family transcriptional regulator [Arthrobacter sp. CDRTa11]